LHAYLASLSEDVSDVVRAAVGVQAIAPKSGPVGAGGGCRSDGHPVAFIILDVPVEVLWRREDVQAMRERYCSLR
jgi:hypothetical protein